MKRTPSSSNDNIDNVNKEYKNGYGRGCYNVGKNQLKIIYIHRVGWFCDSCTQDLIKLNLVIINEQ